MILPWEVYAVRYARHERPARDNFMYPDFHDGPEALEYYVWALVRDGRTIVVDLGFDHAGAARRGRELVRLPSDGLRQLGIDPARVDDVIVTHLHYDHAGDLHAFPAATLHVQDREMAFATGRHMTTRRQRFAFDVDYVCNFVRAVYDERVAFVAGDSEIASGVSVHHVGGHTDGLQVVRVWTRRGWLVLASDAVHLYANRQQQNPFPICFHVGDMIAGYDTVRSLADDESLVIPGHDPAVLERYPAAEAALRGEVVRLDGDPIEAA